MDMDKKSIRRMIAQRKATYAKAELRSMSECVLEKLEADPAFVNARTVLMYYSLGDEVCTHEFVEKWYGRKNILLPVVVGDDLVLKRYEGKNSMIEGAYRILEPSGPEFVDFESIDLIVVPGVAFDRSCHRLGRGKGYYDRLLPKLTGIKIGICFPFQLLDTVPVEPFDVKMDAVLA